MKTHQLIQGSPQWHAYRAQHFNASDAPAMMGCSSYKTRAALMRETATGIAADVGPEQQRRYDDGHRFEALARPLGEALIGEDLYPAVGSEGKYSASFDGLTLMEDTCWEHKSLNDDLRAILPAEGIGSAEVGASLAPMYRIQMEQQCMVSGANRVLFTASKWTQDGELVEARHCWYEPDAELRAAIIASWEHFERELSTYVPPAAAEPAAVGRAPETLPALNIEVTGMVTRSNLAEFKQTALSAIQSVNRNLKTDQDFADAAKAVKWCEDIESRIKAAKEHALSQTSSIEELFRTLDDISSESKRVRLDVSKLVDRRKTEVKEEAVLAARRALDEHIADLHGELAPYRLQMAGVDFAGAIKGLRSIASMQDALDTTLANAKIQADTQARGIRVNIDVFKQRAPGFEFLFADLGQLVHKAKDDFTLVIQSRIEHQIAAEEKRVAAERERIRAEEEARARRLAAEQEAAATEQARQTALALQRENEAQAAVDRAQLATEEQAKAGAALALAAAQASPNTDVRTAAPATVLVPGIHHGPTVVDAQGNSSRVTLMVSERLPEPTLSLGAICGRLGFNVNAAFLADTLHIAPARTDKMSKLYTETQFAAICRQLVSHCSAMGELYAGETA